jgi:hypothetical protein
MKTHHSLQHFSNDIIKHNLNAKCFTHNIKQVIQQITNSSDFLSTFFCDLVRGAVAGGLALNLSHLRLDTPADGLFSVVEVKWSPLCDEASNLWSVRDMCPSLVQMDHSPDSRVLGLRKLVSKCGRRRVSGLIQRFFTLHMDIQTLYSKNGIEQSMGERGKEDSSQPKDDSAY